MTGSFSAILEILDAIANTSSTKGKQAIIAINAGNTLFRHVVVLALDPYKRFKMTGNIQPNRERDVLQPDLLDGRIFFRLSDFCEQSATTKEDRQNLCEMVQESGPSAVEVVNRILNKDLRCGASVLTFRKASPAFDILPIHHPMKGGDDYSKFYKHAKHRKNICWSYKLDGTRTWAVCEGDSVCYLSSNGHELENFHVFDAELRQAATVIWEHTGYANRQIIFDGEVVNIQGDFSRHMSQFRRLKNMDPSGFRFRIFDLISEDRESRMSFRDRYKTLCHSHLPIWQPGDDSSLCSILPHADLEASPHHLARRAVDLGLEGLMLKTWSHAYQHKRSADWCKIKFFHTEDLPVVDKAEGTGKHAGRLGALVVLRGDIKVEVGSGFTDAEREEFWQDPPRCIEVKYQDALASGSLRFPIFVRVRDDKDA